MPAYVPLWTKSNYSFLEGASHPEELVDRAHALGLPAIALTDRDGVHGAVRAHVRAKEVGIKLILGAQITVGNSPANPHSIVALAQNRHGYANLCRLISLGRSRRPKGEALVSVHDLSAFSDDLIILCPVPRLLVALREAFAGRLYGLCTRHRCATDRRYEADLRAAAQGITVPVVANTEILYHTVDRRPLQDVLTCIRHKRTLSSTEALTRPNAEHDLKSPMAMAELFADDPLALQRSLEVAQRCTFDLGQIYYRYPSERLPSGKSEFEWLRELTDQGARRRYGQNVPLPARQQIERELTLIHDLDYCGYFLTMWEIVQFCHSVDILCQGRGSAANSVVCFCLGITAIDPVRMDLLFERFISRERAEPPDIDLDIEHQRREEVIQWVYKRYGTRHAAMVANVIRYRSRSAVRDVGKALSVPQTVIDGLAKQTDHYGSDVDPRAMARLGLDPHARSSRLFLQLVADILDFPRHLSIHPGGFLLGHDPVDTLVPIEPATMENRSVIQWDKYDVENLGLFKVDLLGLGALTHIHGCFDLLREHDDLDLSLSTIPSKDASTFDMISRGETIGVFQIESRAQMAMLPRLRPRHFYDLVIEVAIVRPGPIQGDMVHPYLRRRNGEEEVEYPHPDLKRVLAKTLGVPIFQEQVMKLAVLAAGYTPGEADQLRRDMAAWHSSGKIDRHRDRLIRGMQERGISSDFAERVFSQIQGFGEYGFPESHAASFALIAYVTAWLRCHHLPAFSCALLNAQPMGFYAPSTIIDDARRRGVEFRPIDAQRSSWDCTLEAATPDSPHPHAVRMGMRYLKGFGAREHSRLLQARGPYLDLPDFCRRTGLPQAKLHVMAEAGVFACFGYHRRDAIWAVRGLAVAAADSMSFTSAPESDPPSFNRLGRHDGILWDYHTAMHSTRGHPMDGLRPELRQQGLPQAHAVTRLRNGARVRYVGLVICRQRPATASGVTFFTLEDETGFVNLVVWRDVFQRHALLAKSAALLGVTGRVQASEGVVHVVAESLWEPRVSHSHPSPRSRDFH